MFYRIPFSVATRNSSGPFDPFWESLTADGWATRLCFYNVIPIHLKQPLTLGIVLFASFKRRNECVKPRKLIVLLYICCLLRKLCWRTRKEKCIRSVSMPSTVSFHGTLCSSSRMAKFIISNNAKHHNHTRTSHLKCLWKEAKTLRPL